MTSLSRTVLIHANTVKTTWLADLRFGNLLLLSTQKYLNSLIIC